MTPAIRAYSDAFHLKSLDLSGAKPRRSFLCELCVYGRGQQAEWCMEHSKYGRLWNGDMLVVELADGRKQSVVVSDYKLNTWKAQVHPHVGPDFGWFDAAQVQRWRDEHWDRLKSAGITPQMVAEAMYPEIWRSKTGAESYDDFVKAQSIP